MKKLWILAEPESFFLSHLSARLADKNAVHGIIELKFSSTLREKLRHFKKLTEAFGFGGVTSIGASLVMSKVLNLLCSDCYYSLEKVARKYGLRYIKCSGFNDPVLIDLLENSIKDELVLTQVGRLVPKSLTDNYTLINKHCAILPKYPGVLPVFWAMLDGEEFHGVTIHRMNEKIDRGAILAQKKIQCEDDMFEIYHRLYSETFLLLLGLLQRKDISGHSVSEQDNNKFLYYTYPTFTERKKFVREGFRFGFPLRIRKVK